MGRIHRYRTALSRHHRSAGFGIHSPFAFNFVRGVLRERLPYYEYDNIARLHQAVKATKHRQEPLISKKDAKMLFRIANYFNPSHLLVTGSRHGVSVASMMAVSSQSHLYLYEPRLSGKRIAEELIEPFRGATDCFSDLATALSSYRAAVGHGEAPFLLLNELPGDADDEEQLKPFLFDVIEHTGVVIMTHLDQNRDTSQLWRLCEQRMPHGQSFTNEKIGIIVANPKLNVEHFFLWF